MTTSFEARAAAAVRGDAAVLGELLREFGPLVREQLSIDARWRSVLDPDDVMQVTYLEAFLKIHEWTPGGPGTLVAWLQRIAHHNLLDAVRGLEAQKRPPPVRQAAADSAVQLLDALGVTSSTPSRVAAGAELTTVLERALQALPADYASVIQLYDLQGLPIADVSSRMHRTAGAVHMLRARAHDLLRDLLGPDSKFFTHTA